MSEKPPRHQSVLLREAARLLVSDPKGLYLDATLGLGGHAQAILDALRPEGRLLGLDLDPASLRLAEERLRGRANFEAARANFRDAARELKGRGFLPLSGALYDLGVSSLHFETAERGFSLRLDGPLDMRLSPDNPLTAATIVNRWPEEQLALLLKDYGEEPQARRIARAIAERRAQKPFETTLELARLLEGLLPRGKTHQATRTFQALRIAVNSELENLSQGLEAIVPLLRPGGRLVVISFHSLEDRIVKTLFSSLTREGSCRFVEDRGPLKPSPEELERNPRARSAKLRAVEKQ
ncbi:MAG: 16S rRNA (cytosine(1402)-N(4))-methyltransferase RsmH [Elusimicrobia bacterium]|nr:16S rRNA (cytosine(1402)-N(4))-methyltransferase RsmH [Elusimicrobiota bacterium]MDE2238036.1 16S rRNA (cytosine(1402)-N(4))-methyltransferase RsmH [Elusimicrobiota bacterium]MDE2425510.1 16S rRNA (cytosine(1402)-N(4))-methyltransferase RsmH [Elusimicrobiota bacterium]